VKLAARSFSAVVLASALGSLACGSQAALATAETDRATAAPVTPSAPSGRAVAATTPLPPAVSSAAAAPLLPSWPPPASGAVSDFCIETVTALDESSCYALPDAPTDELLLYLHGIVPPAKTSRQKTNFETVVSVAARRAGVAALMPRGRQGLAPKGHDGWWGWPTSANAYARWSDELTAEFAEKRAKLEALSGRRFKRLYVAGSSSGAYFVVALALRGAIAADGFAAISGGALPAGADFRGRATKPFYIGYGTADTVGPGANALAARLRAAGFPVKVAAHPLPHGAAEVYLDEAFAHFRAHQP
jgi:predicted esterase